MLNVLPDEQKLHVIIAEVTTAEILSFLYFIRLNNGFKYCCILYVNNNTQYIVNYNAKCFASFILIH